MQKIRCIFDGSASPFPSCALIVLSGKIFTRLKVVKTSKITSSQKRLVFYFFHHLNTVFSLVNILNLMEINIVLFLVSIFSSVRPKRRLKILWSKRIDNSQCFIYFLFFLPFVMTFWPDDALLRKNYLLREVSFLTQDSF